MKVDREKITENWLGILEVIATAEEAGENVVGERRELLKLIDNSLKYPGKFEKSIIEYAMGTKISS